MSDLPVLSSETPNPQMPANRKTEAKEPTPEELARMEASWARIASYDPRSETKIPAYESLDAVSKERLDGVAREVILTIKNLATIVGMDAPSFKCFNHPAVYGLFFALQMETFPKIVDAIIGNSLFKDMKFNVQKLYSALKKLDAVVKEVPNNTLHPYLIEQALAYIPNHPMQSVGDLVQNLEGLGASADRDTEDTIFGAEA